MIPRKISKRKLYLMLGDIFLIILSLNLAFLIRLKRPVSFLNLNNGFVSFLFILTAFIISFYIFDLYNIRFKFGNIRFLGLILASLIFVTLLVIVFFYFFPFKLGRGVFFICLGLTGIFIYIWRMLYSSFFRIAIPQINVLIVGTRKSAKVIYSILKKEPEYKIIGFIGNNPRIRVFPKMKILGNSQSLEKIVNEYDIDDIVVTIDPSRNKQLNTALVNCKMRGINISNTPSYYEYLTAKIPVDYIKENWFLYCDGFDKLGSKIYTRLKRIMDLSTSLFCFIASLPIGLIIILSLKLSSRGSIFLIQERIGKNKKPFKLHKFRTMKPNSENEVPLWAKENDPRITSLGKILRKTRLDELPQLINVIKGEMSLIGPRPERDFFIKELKEKIPHYSLRFVVKPGITGWAQINYRYGSTVEDAIEKLRYDLYYIKNMSLLLDLKILLRTIKTIITGAGR